MINYNILGEIIDKVALNQWKDRVKRINKHYHTIFVLYDNKLNTTLSDDCCDECVEGMGQWVCYNYRNLDRVSPFIYIYHQRFDKCSKCGINEIMRYSTIDVIFPDYI